MAINQILVGVDDRPPGRQALSWAAGEAESHQAVLRLVRVVCDIDWLFSAAAADIAKLEASSADDARMLDDAARSAHELAPKIEIVSELITGDLFEQLNALTADADLLVLGADEDSTGGNLVGDWFTAHAKCPVQVVS